MLGSIAQVYIEATKVGEKIGAARPHVVSKGMTHLKDESGPRGENAQATYHLFRHTLLFTMGADDAVERIRRTASGLVIVTDLQLA